MKTYREQIIETVNNLNEVRMLTFEQIVNLTMSNEYSDFDKEIEIGDQVSLSLNMFEAAKDTNVQHLISLCKETEKTILTLLNINGIDEKEVELTF